MDTIVKWMSWACVLLTFVFAICGFAAVLEWFDRGLANMIAKSAGAALVGVVLLIAGILSAQKARE